MTTAIVPIAAIPYDPVIAAIPAKVDHGVACKFCRTSVFPQADRTAMGNGNFVLTRISADNGSVSVAMQAPDLRTDQQLLLTSINAANKIPRGLGRFMPQFNQAAYGDRGFETAERCGRAGRDHDHTGSAGTNPVAGHLIGRFRLSVTDAARTRERWQNLTPKIAEIHSQFRGKA